MEHYTIFGDYVQENNIEHFANEETKKTPDELLDELISAIENGEKKEQIVFLLDQVKSKDVYSKLPKEDKATVDKLVKKYVKNIDGLNLVGNLEMSGIVKAHGFHLMDGTKVKEVEKKVHALPLNDDGDVVINNNIQSGGSINIKKDVVIGEKIYSNHGIHNQHNNKILSTDKDWTRIGQGSKPGRIAMYGGTSVNGTHDGKGGLGVGYWGYPGQGNINASKNITAGGKIVASKSISSKGDIVASKNISTSGKMYTTQGIYNQHNQKILSTDKDWTRIGQGQKPGRIAIHGGTSINGTYSGNAGLGVGYWGYPGAGKIHAKGNISTDQKIYSTHGIYNQHNHKILSTDKDWTRIGQGSKPGRIAVYGGTSINGTHDGKGGLGVGYWGHPGQGKIHAKGNISTDQKIYSTHGIYNQHNHKILSTDKDWTRIGQGQKPGRIAIYGGTSINGTHDGKAGLGVGYWGHPGAGKIHATKGISSAGGMNVTGGRTYFKDAENKGRVRVGAAWGIPGLYSEDGQDIVIGCRNNKSVHLGHPNLVRVDGKGNIYLPTNANIYIGNKKVVKNGDPFTMRSGRTGKRIQDAATNARFENKNRASWEKMYMELL